MKVELTEQQAEALRAAAYFVLAGDYLETDGGPLRDERQAETLRRAVERVKP